MKAIICGALMSLTITTANAAEGRTDGRSRFPSGSMNREGRGGCRLSTPSCCGWTSLALRGSSTTIRSAPRPVSVPPTEVAPKAIRTDNGVPFASPNALFGLSKLSVWWLRLGIEIERIKPGHPQQNGRHERMHLTLKLETAKPAGRNFLQQQAKFDDFIECFNNERPHHALSRQSDTCPQRVPTEACRNLITHFAGAFFPNSDPVVQQLNAAVLFAAGFLVRPDALAHNSGPDRTGAFCCAVAWTHHTTGVQMIRAAAIIQGLLGNTGRPGGGILALRGHCSIQGSTDSPTLYNMLPTYLPQPWLAAATRRPRSRLP
jgi:Integrase core domain